jgi:hypothetical protein
VPIHLDVPERHLGSRRVRVVAVMEPPDFLVSQW